MNEEENKLVPIKKCHWCNKDLYKKHIQILSNARGYGYYAICPNCNKENVIEEIDTTESFGKCEISGKKSLEKCERS